MNQSKYKDIVIRKTEYYNDFTSVYVSPVPSAEWNQNCSTLPICLAAIKDFCLDEVLGAYAIGRVGHAYHVCCCHED